MKNNKKIDITMIVDRSGSMAPIREQVVKSYNDFLLEQKAVEGKASISLIQFDDQYEVHYEGIDIKDAKDLNRKSYEPRGMTALNDAIGRTISNMKLRLKKSKASVVVVITTDGMENASEEYTRSQIRELIKECEDNLGWRFIYLAADDASFDEWEDMGVHRGRAMKSGRGNRAHQHASNVMSSKLMAFRHSNRVEDLDFTDKERQDAENLDEG